MSSAEVDSAAIGPVGNTYDKYGTKNPVARAMMKGFLASVGSFYRTASPRRVLEVGCGEGHLASHLVGLHAPEQFVACDLSLDRLAVGADPRIEFLQASVYELPFPAGSFDLVICCEVLEHLSEPQRGLQEIARVTSDRVLLSTPREPLWRILNVARGKYLRDFGNTPGHVQHFSSGALRGLVAQHFEIEASRQPIPWTVLSCRLPLFAQG